MRTTETLASLLALFYIFAPSGFAQHLEFPRQIFYTCEKVTEANRPAYFDRDYDRPFPAPRPAPLSSYVIADFAEARVQLSGEARTTQPSEENQSVSGKVGVTYGSTARQSTMIARVGVAANEEPIESNLAPIFLSPGNGGARYSGYIQLNLNYWKTSGIYLYAGLDAYDWSAKRLVDPLIDNGLTEQEALEELGLRSLVERANVVSLGGGLYYLLQRHSQSTQC